MPESAKELHERMTPHVLRAGVGEKGWNKIVHNFSRKSPERQLFIIDFLKSFHATEWKEVNDVWTLPNATEEMWENMSNMFDESPFPELMMLRRAQRKLKDRWVSFKEQLKGFIKNERSEEDD